MSGRACNIGELNGGWAVLLKLALILIPIHLLFQGWCVVRIMDMATFQARIVTFVSVIHGPIPDIK